MRTQRGTPQFRVLSLLLMLLWNAMATLVMSTDLPCAARRNLRNYRCSKANRTSDRTRGLTCRTHQRASRTQDLCSCRNCLTLVAHLSPFNLHTNAKKEVPAIPKYTHVLFRRLATELVRSGIARVHHSRWMHSENNLHWDISPSNTRARGCSRY